MAKQPKSKKDGADPKSQSAAKSAAKKPRKRAAKPANMPTEPPPEVEPENTERVAADAGEPVRITPPPAKSGSSGAWLMVVFLIIVIGGGGAYLSFPKWYPYAEPYVADYLPDAIKINIVDPRFSRLSDRLNELESQAQQLKEKDKTIASLENERAKLSETLASVLDRIASVEQSIDAVRNMVRSTASAEEAARASRSLKKLNERLAQLEAIRQTAGEASTQALPEVLNERIVNLEQRLPDTSGLAARIAKLEAAENAAERSRLATQELARSVPNLERRLAKVESRPTAATDPKAGSSATVLLVAQLRDAVHSGQPFAKILDSVRAVAGEDPGMRAPLLGLANHAGSGIATLNDLRDDFSQLAGPIVSASRNRDGGNWFDDAVNRVTSLVTLRRTDAAGSPQSVDALVAITEDRLAAGDLIAAVEAAEGIEALSAAAHGVAAAWITKAKARLAAERSLASLHVHAVSLLTPAKD